MADLLSIYRHATRARLLSERLRELARAGRIGFHPEGRFFEPAICAAVLAMGAEDQVFPGAREQAAFVARGIELERYVSSAFGTYEDPMCGHTAPAHLSARQLRVGSPSGLVSNHLTHAAGFAWASALAKEPTAVLTLFGASAADAGDFHSALNFAGATKSPIVFFCRTDRTVKTHLPSPIESVAEKAIGYGMEGVTCAAEDVRAVTNAVERALSQAKNGGGPVLVEAIRRDPNDPLDALRATLVEQRDWDPRRDLDLRRETMIEIEAAVSRATLAGPPAREMIFDHVFAELPRHLETQRDHLLASPLFSEKTR
jgi:TPP-dependent pyruvate/acetoin dehydrogenase alpha subunit